MKAKLRLFFIKFKTLSIFNIIFLALFAVINMSNYMILSNSRSARVESLAYISSKIAKQETSKSVNFSFVNSNPIDNETLKNWADYAYLQTYWKTDTIGYETRLTINSNNYSSSLFIDALGHDYTGIICKNMTFDVSTKNEKEEYISYQTKLHFMFNNKGNTKSDFKPGTTNYIYIRQSDAKKLITNPSSDYYGLEYVDLLGKPLDVKMVYRSGTEIIDMWKIDNIILEEIEGKRDDVDKHLSDLFGNYFMSSMYGFSIWQGFCMQYELSTSSSANYRNINRAFAKFGSTDLEVFLDAGEKASVNDLNSAKSIINSIITKRSNDTLLLIVCCIISFLYLAATYFVFSKIKAFRSTNIFLYIVIFAIEYFVLFALGGFFPASMYKLFSNYAIGINFVLMVMSISLLLITKIGLPNTYPVLPENLDLKNKEAKKGDKDETVR